MEMLVAVSSAVAEIFQQTNTAIACTTVE